MPRRFGTCASESAELVTHVLLPSGSPEFVGLYHNRSPQLIRGISVECLFARFAWSLFTDEHIPFFQSDLEYTVRLWDKAKGEAETQTLRGLDVRSSAQVFESTRPQSRSVSPKKRSLPTQSGGVDGGDGDWSDDGDSTGDEHDGDSWDEPPRGRSRKRHCEALGRDGEVPSLSTSFASTTQSRIASGQSRQASQPLTPKEGENNASLKSAGDTTGSQKPLKRIHIEERDVES